MTLVPPSLLPFFERLGQGVRLEAVQCERTRWPALRPGMALLAALALCLAVSPRPGLATDAYSSAERALFMTDHLGATRAPTTLRYTFRKSGSLEEGFDDKVTVILAAPGNARCCTATTAFLGGTRRINLPEIDSPQGNPVILHFLERDIREMQRLTKGQPNYFRKRIRMAVFQGAKITEIKVPYGGSLVAAQQMVIAPYVDDPLRPRYEKFADKQYVFTLSPGVPGGVYAIRAQVDSQAQGAPALLVDEMTLDDPASAKRTTAGTPSR